MLQTVLLNVLLLHSADLVTKCISCDWVFKLTTLNIRVSVLNLAG